MTPEPPGGPREELRLALAMRGGVSLAVWIGGAVAEIDELRRASLAPDGGTRGFWGGLLDAAGFGSVLVDVMTGASAGGLNGVLYASALRTGRRVDGVRDVWLEQASMARLLADERPTGLGPVRSAWHRLVGPPAPTRASVLDGDFFATALETEVAHLLADGSAADRPFVQAHPLSLFLSATIVGGSRTESRADPWSPEQGLEREALFRFRHAGTGPELSDFTTADARTLALAARTTASFPLAFEPVRWTAAGGDGRLSGPDGMLVRNPELMDGGVVDNIPVARAISAIVSSSAASTSTRWLLYLQPSPGVPQALTAPAGPHDPPSSLASVARKVAGSLQSESVLDDLAELREQNDQARLVSAARAAALTDVRPGPAGGADVATDAARLDRLLTEPARELDWVPLRTAAPVSPIAGLDDDHRQRLRTAIEAELSSDARVAIVGALPSLGMTSVRPLPPIARTAMLVVDWARDVTDRASPSADDAVATVNAAKASAYTVLQVAQQLQAHLDRTAITAADGLTATGAPAWIAGRHAAADALLNDPDVVALAARADRATWDRVDGPGSDTLRDLAAGTFRPAAMTTDDPDARAAVGALWDRLVTAAVAIADTVRSSELVAPARVDSWTATLDTVTDADAMATALDGMDRATLGLHGGGTLHTSRPIRYTRVSGASYTPLALDGFEFEVGRAGDRRHVGFRAPEPNLVDVAAGWLVPGSQPTMDSRRKLAGDEIANFTAFLTARWRQNDWMWGQLDAAKSLVDIVLDPERLVRIAGTARPVDAARALTAEIRAIVRRGAMPQADVLWQRYGDFVELEIHTMLTAPDTGPRALAVTKALLLCRRHWELLGDELPRVLTTPLRDDRPAASADVAAPDLETAIASYGKMDRDIASVWGRKWISTIGVTAVSQLLSALTPRGPADGLAARSRRWAAQIAFFPVKALVLALVGLLLGRTRGVAALAFLVDLVVLPRLEPTARWIVFGVTTVAFAALGVVTFLRRSRRGVDTPSEVRWHQLGELASVVLAAAAVLFGFLLCLDIGGLASEHVYPARLRDPTSSHGLTLAYAACVVVGTGVMLWMLWGWATPGRRLLVAAVAAAVMLASAWASVQHGQRDTWWMRPVEWVASMWWGLAVTLVVTISWAVKRRPVSIAYRPEPSRRVAPAPDHVAP